jgi:hypothetical protein
MHANMSNLDRAVPAFLATAAPVAALVSDAGSVAGVPLLSLTTLMAVTAALGFCLIHALLHIDSRGRRPLTH